MSDLDKLAARIADLHGTLKLRPTLAVACEIGDLLADAKSSLPHGEWTPWLRSRCPHISVRTARVYLQVATSATNRQATADLTLDRFLKMLRGAPPMGNSGEVHRQNWRTPTELFVRLHDIFHFSADAAADAESALISRHWTDALSADWAGETVFANPPFSSCEKWVAKAVEATTAVLILPLNSLSTEYVHNAPPVLIVLPRGRVRFTPPPGVEGRRPALGSAVAVWGDISAEQRRQLGAVGRVYQAT